MEETNSSSARTRVSEGCLKKPSGGSFHFESEFQMEISVYPAFHDLALFYTAVSRRTL